MESEEFPFELSGIQWDMFEFCLAHPGCKEGDFVDAGIASKPVVYRTIALFEKVDLIFRAKDSKTRAKRIYINDGSVLMTTLTKIDLFGTYHLNAVDEIIAYILKLWPPRKGYEKYSPQSYNRYSKIRKNSPSDRVSPHQVSQRTSQLVAAIVKCLEVLSLVDRAYTADARFYYPRVHYHPSIAAEFAAAIARRFQNLYQLSMTKIGYAVFVAAPGFSEYLDFTKMENMLTKSLFETTFSNFDVKLAYKLFSSLELSARTKVALDFYSKNVRTLALGS